jgi:hypothetical protein
VGNFKDDVFVDAVEFALLDRVFLIDDPNEDEDEDGVNGLLLIFCFSYK